MVLSTTDVRLSTFTCFIITRAQAQVKLFARDLAKAERHPVVEERPLGRHRERPDICAVGRSGGTELFNVTICHLLNKARNGFYCKYNRKETNHTVVFTSNRTRNLTNLGFFFTISVPQMEH